MLVGVVCSLLLAIGTFYLALVDLRYFFGLVLDYGTQSAGASIEAKGDLRSDVITSVVKVLDGFLISAILIITALGILFVSAAVFLTSRFSSSGEKKANTEE